MGCAPLVVESSDNSPSEIIIIDDSNASAVLVDDSMEISIGAMSIDGPLPDPVP